MVDLADGARRCATARWWLAVALAVVSLLAGCAGGEGEAQSESTEKGGSAEVAAAHPSNEASGDAWPVAEVAAEVEPSVVQVNVEAIRTTPFGPQEGRGLGSGVIYRTDGYIVTNNHVVEGSTRSTSPLPTVLRSEAR